MLRTIDEELRDRVLDRFGLSGPPASSAEGVASLYLAWCTHIPFDNVRKLLALHGPDAGADPPAPLPTMDAVDFFEAWLAHGVGGTCWPSSNALHALVAACGFEVAQLAASMGDEGVATHATAVVTVEDERWLLDTSMLTRQPLRLSTTEATATDDPVAPTAARPVAEGWLFDFPKVHETTPMPCRTISPSGVDLRYCASRYEWSRTNGIFNDSLAVRFGTADRLVRLSPRERHDRTAAGITGAPCTGDELARTLVEDVGMSEEIVSSLRRARSS